MWAVKRSRSSRMWQLPLGLCFVMAPVAAYGDDEGTTEPPSPPGAFSITVETTVESVRVAWTAQAGVDLFVVTLTSNPTLTKSVAGAATEAVFTSDDGVEDGTEYEAAATAYNEGGSTASSNNPTVTTNFFPWDENYPTSLHFTRAGKPWFYNEVPNSGYEGLTSIPYSQLPCQECHRPDQAPGTNGCESCHDTAEPTLGAQVDASLSGVCGGCHGRQSAERSAPANYTDAHDAVSGGDCMFCHTMEDMHGDGTAYNSMLEDGAIDASCDDCHTSVPSNSYHASVHDNVDCSTCHMQGVVSCYNCHFEGQVSVPETKMARGRIVDWMFLVNRNGKVHPANLQTLEYQGETFVAFAPFYSHTIAKNAVTSCDDCHGNAAVLDLAADSSMVVVSATDQNADFATNGWGIVPTHQMRIPVPFNYTTAFQFDFVHFNDQTGLWEFAETGPDGFHILFGTPLTDAQLSKID